LWDKAQAVNERLAKLVENAREPQTYLFSGKVFCADCQVVMMPHSEKRHRGKNGHDCNERRNTYHCKTYHVSGRQRCSRHSINEEALKKTVLDNIQAHAVMLSLNEERMTAELRRRLISDFSADKAEVQRELTKLKQTLHNLDLKLEQIYEDKITGVISAETFTPLAEKVEAERVDVAGTITLMELSNEKAKARLGDIQSWIRLIKANAAVTVLDRDMLDALIERIEVGESNVEDGVKVQDIRIVYRFVGML
jgi:hypothetical protein